MVSQTTKHHVCCALALLSLDLPVSHFLLVGRHTDQIANLGLILARANCILDLEIRLLYFGVVARVAVKAEAYTLTWLLEGFLEADSSEELQQLAKRLARTASATHRCDPSKVQRSINNVCHTAGWWFQ